MLIEVTKKVIKERENFLTGMKNHKYQNILEKAKKQWCSYEPKKQKSKIYAIDSSFNVVKFQGIQLWVVDAVAINIEADTKSRLFDVGLGRENTLLASTSSKMEMKAFSEVTDLADLVLMDGSVYSHFTTKHTPIENLKKILGKNNNSVFISKTSNSNIQFGKYDSFASDIFYFNHVSRKSGFSKFFKDTTHGKNYPIISSYVRLQNDTPLMKIEILADSLDENEFKNILNQLVFEAVGNYPRSLKMAHNECKIAKSDMRKLVSLLGLSNEIGSRDLLE